MPLAVVPDLEAELDRLYGLPLEQFTAARNELAKRLRQAGQREAADDVKALAKPSVAVWAVNQLARRRRADVQRLLEAGATLREAQAAALAGKEVDVAGAVAAERRAVRTLLGASAELVSETQRERVAALLRAAAIDEDARPLLEAGRLTGDVQPTGFAALAGLPATPARRAPARAKDDRAARRRLIAEARTLVKELAEETLRLRGEAEASERDARRARRVAEEAEQHAERAGAAAEEADQRLAEAKAELERLQRAAGP